MWQLYPNGTQSAMSPASARSKRFDGPESGRLNRAVLEPRRLGNELLCVSVVHGGFNDLSLGRGGSVGGWPGGLWSEFRGENRFGRRTSYASFKRLKSNSGSAIMRRPEAVRTAMRSSSALCVASNSAWLPLSASEGARCTPGFKGPPGSPGGKRQPQRPPSFDASPITDARTATGSACAARTAGQTPRPARGSLNAPLHPGRSESPSNGGSPVPARRDW